MSSADTTTEQHEGKGAKRGPEESEERPEVDPSKSDVTSPPPTKTAKPNPSSPSVDMSSPGGVAVEVKAETDSARVEAEALSSLGLAVGTRLEVMWLLEDGDKSVEKVSAQPDRTGVLQIQTPRPQPLLYRYFRKRATKPRSLTTDNPPPPPWERTKLGL